LGRAAQAVCALFLLLWALWFAAFLGFGGRDAPNVDFIVYWTAAELTADGDASLAYNPEAFEARQVEAVGEQADGFPWIYPPVAFLLVLPLALLPYGAAFGAWLAVTGGVLFAAVRRLSPNSTTVWLAAAFPATMFNLIIGQAGLLTAGLFAWAMLLLPARPIAAGALVGLLAFKPHFLPLILLALLAGRQKQALLASLASAGVFSAASLALFGAGAWEAFVSNLNASTDMLYGEVFPIEKMQSVTSLMLTLGAGAFASQVVQGVTSVGAAALVVWLWRKGLPFEYKAAGLGLASLLATPYVYHYDLTVMGVALLFVARRAQVTGWQAWERPALAVAWFAPIISFLLGTALSLSLGVFVLFGPVALLVRRVQADTAADAPSSQTLTTAA
jgi:hypothetical protein